MAFSIPGLNVITLTEAAAARVREIVGSAGEGASGLRVGIKKGGCAGMEYTFEVARDERPGDEIIPIDGGKVIVDAKAVLFLLGSELDFTTSKLASHFVFRNPNETSACGCGESVNLTEASPARLHAPAAE